MAAYETEVRIVVMSIQRSRKLWKWICECLQARICIRVDCGKPLHRRGLCTCHHARWRRQRNALPKKARDNYDAELIEQGKLLEPMQGQRFDIDNDYQTNLAEVS